MPDLKSIQQLRDVDLERVSYAFEGQTIDDARAVSLVTKTFGAYESGRRNEEQRWAVAERLYNGVVEKRTWEGTKKPRASLAVPIVFDQVETAFPIITEALFEYYPTFFDVVPGRGSTPADAQKVRDTFTSWLEAPYDETGMTAIPALEKAIRQAEIFGDGAIELSWDSELKRPIVEWLDIRDLYMDPAAPGPIIDGSKAVITVKRLTVEQLEEMRGLPGVTIPTHDELNMLAKMRYMTGGDMVRMEQASARKEQLSIDLPVDPRHQTVEVLVYWTKDRLIWVLGRVYCAVNMTNPFGFIPICKAPYIEVLGRPWSMGIPDVLEGDQKYAQGIRNARLDNLALALHPPRKRQRGEHVPESQLAWRPGALDQVADISQVEVMKVENVTSDAYREEQIIHQQAAKRLGINEMAQSGTPTPSNANRSATGVQQQSMSVTRRLRTAVKNFENYLIVPMLYKMQWMARKFAPEMLEVEQAGGDLLQVPKGVFDSSVKFQMQAASRMVVRDRLAMFLQPISQLLFNDVVAGMASKQGMTIDFNEWERFLQDATATSKSYKFFRPMSPQEQQAMNQPSPEMMAQMQMKQQELQARMGLGQMKQQAEMEKINADRETKSGETAERSAREILKAVLSMLGGAGGSGAKTGGGSAGNGSGI